MFCSHHALRSGRLGHFHTLPWVLRQGTAQSSTLLQQQSHFARLGAWAPPLCFLFESGTVGSCRSSSGTRRSLGILGDCEDNS